jgi:hypothetical protein
MHLLRIFTLITILLFSILANAKPGTSSSADNYTNPDLVFRLLLAEIASQRGELNLASELFLDLAKQTDNALLAERATKITGYTRNAALALEASKVGRCQSYLKGKSWLKKVQKMPLISIVVS